MKCGNSLIYSIYMKILVNFKEDKVRLSNKKKYSLFFHMASNRSAI